MASPVTREAVLDALQTVQDPDQHRDIVSLGLIRDLVVQGGKVSFTIEFTTHSPAAKVALHSQARRAVAQLPGVSEVNARIATTAPAQVHAHPSQHPSAQPPIPQVRNTVAISSGKGGVGKSTVAVNLSLALHETGAQVGLVDFDIYGPNIPLMMGARGRPGMFQNRIIPVMAYDVKIMSIGFFVKEGDAVIWRGPMVHSAIQQFLKDVEWGEIEYLICDMPPGTGDAQLSLTQAIPLSGAVMVTTPQEDSLQDVRKGLAMFRKLNVPLLGVVENMSYFACPHCGERTHIFGEGGGQTLAQEFDVPLLGRVPLDPETRVGGDAGEPILIRKPDSPQSEAFRQVARDVAARLATLQVPQAPVIS